MILKNGKVVPDQPMPERMLRRTQSESDITQVATSPDVDPPNGRNESGQIDDRNTNVVVDPQLLNEISRSQRPLFEMNRPPLANLQGPNPSQKALQPNERGDFISEIEAFLSQYSHEKSGPPMENTSVSGPAVIGYQYSPEGYLDGNLRAQPPSDGYVEQRPFIDLTSERVSNAPKTPTRRERLDPTNLRNSEMRSRNLNMGHSWRNEFANIIDESREPNGIVTRNSRNEVGYNTRLRADTPKSPEPFSSTLEPPFHTVNPPTYHSINGNLTRADLRPNFESQMDRSHLYPSRSANVGPRTQYYCQPIEQHSRRNLDVNENDRYSSNPSTQPNSNMGRENAYANAYVHHDRAGPSDIFSTRNRYVGPSYPFDGVQGNNVHQMSDERFPVDTEQNPTGGYPHMGGNSSVGHSRTNGLLNVSDEFPPNLYNSHWQSNNYSNFGEHVQQGRGELRSMSNPSLTNFSSCRNRRRKHLEAEKYDGKTDLNDYLRHFEKISKWNEWTLAEKAMQLGMHLHEGAEKTFDSLPENEKNDYFKIVSCLRRNYGQMNQAFLYQEKFWQRKKLVTEGLVNYAQDIQDFSLKAFGDMVNIQSPGFNKMLVHRFVSGLGDEDSAKWVHMQHATDLNDAVKIARDLESFDEVHNRPMLKPKSHGINAVVNRSENDECLKILKQISEGLAGNTQQLQNMAAKLEKTSSENKQNQYESNPDRNGSYYKNQSNPGYNNGGQNNWRNRQNFDGNGPRNNYRNNDNRPRNNQNGSQFNQNRGNFNQDNTSQNRYYRENGPRPTHVDDANWRNKNGNSGQVSHIQSNIPTEEFFHPETLNSLNQPLNAY